MYHHIESKKSETSRILIEKNLQFACWSVRCTRFSPRFLQEAAAETEVEEEAQLPLPPKLLVFLMFFSCQFFAKFFVQHDLKIMVDFLDEFSQDGVISVWFRWVYSPSEDDPIGRNPYGVPGVCFSSATSFGWRVRSRHVRSAGDLDAGTWFDGSFGNLLQLEPWKDP